MKKSIIIFWTVLTTCSLMAFGYFNINNPQPELMAEEVNQADVDFVYAIEPRFINRITKSDLRKATTIAEILPKRATERIALYFSTGVVLLDKNGKPEKQVDNISPNLNQEQLDLIQEINYSDNILIRADFKEKNLHTDILTSNYLTYYMTVLPEKSASYPGGNDALMTYVKKSSPVDHAVIDQNQLQPGKVYFTITKKGEIVNTTLNTTSGYDSIDQQMIDIVNSFPIWDPARDVNGLPVEQKLVFFFGKMGC